MTDRDAAPAGVASGPTVDAATVLAKHSKVVQFCEKCRANWPCEAVLLARRVIELEAALAQWDRWADPPFVPGAAWPVGEE